MARPSICVGVEQYSGYSEYRVYHLFLGSNSFALALEVIMRKDSCMICWREDHQFVMLEMRLVFGKGSKYLVF